MQGKDKADLRRCVELLTEMLENEGRGMCLFLISTVMYMRVFMNFALEKKLKFYIVYCDRF